MLLQNGQRVPPYNPHADTLSRPPRTALSRPTRRHPFSCPPCYPFSSPPCCPFSSPPCHPFSSSPCYPLCTLSRPPRATLCVPSTVTYILCPSGPNGELLQRDRADVDLDAPDADQALTQELGHHRINQDLGPPFPLHQDVADLRRPWIRGGGFVGRCGAKVLLRGYWG